MDQMRAYEPTWRERAASGLQDVLMSRFGMSAYDAMKMAQKITGGGQGAVAGMGLLDVTPVGLAFGAQEGGLQAGEGAARAAGGDVMGGLLGMGAGALAVAPVAKVSRKAVTVRDPQRISYPGIYSDPRELVAEAASRVAPEDPMLKRLFGVTRDDLWQIGQQGMRQGNLQGIPFKTAASPRGAAHVENITTPKNTQRVQDLIAESMNRPELHEPMASWYVMDPLFDEFKRLHGAQAVPAYNKFNALTGMASPGSEVLTELNRGTAANWLSTQGRWDDFMKFGGLAEDKRTKNFPVDMRAVIGHPYHKTAQATAMDSYVRNGVVDMGSAKVPSYIAASGVPDTGFQSNWMVSDAHHSRIIGLPDVRNPSFKKGVEVLPNASASVPEVISMQPWWENQVAIPTGLSSVGAQGVVWGAGSGATGVTSPIGAPKLELLAMQINKAAQRLGITPEEARDRIIRGQAHAGRIDPEMAAALAAGAGAAAVGGKYLLSDE